MSTSTDEPTKIYIIACAGGSSMVGGAFSRNSYALNDDFTAAQNQSLGVHGANIFAYNSETRGVQSVMTSVVNNSSLSPMEELPVPEELTDVTKNQFVIPGETTEGSSLSGGCSPGFYFALELLKDKPVGTKVVLVQCAIAKVPAVSFDKSPELSWAENPKNFSLQQYLHLNTAQAILAIKRTELWQSNQDDAFVPHTNAEIESILLWCGGDADENMSKNDFKDNILDLAKNFKSIDDFDKVCKSVKVVLMPIANNETKVNKALQELAEEKNWMCFEPNTEWMNNASRWAVEVKYTDDDGNKRLFYNGDGVRRLAHDAFRAYLKL